MTLFMTPHYISWRANTYLYVTTNDVQQTIHPSGCLPLNFLGLSLRNFFQHLLTPTTLLVSLLESPSTYRTIHMRKMPIRRHNTSQGRHYHIQEAGQLFPAGQQCQSDQWAYWLPFSARPPPPLWSAHMYGLFGCLDTKSKKRKLSFTPSHNTCDKVNTSSVPRIRESPHPTKIFHVKTLSTNTTPLFTSGYDLL